MLDYKVKNHDFGPITNDGSTCRKCGIQVSATVLTWGGVGLTPCQGFTAIIDLLPVDDDKCECGAHKALGAKRKCPGHSSWCPWSV